MTTASTLSRIAKDLRVDVDQLTISESVADRLARGDVGKATAKREQPERGRMNKTEKRYADHLEAQLSSGNIADYRFEPITLRLAKKTTYTPDFAVVTDDYAIELHDVKGRKGAGPGGWEEDARVKIKVAAQLYPWFTFVGITPSKSIAQWSREVFKP